MRAELPNLELIEYKALQIIQKLHVARKQFDFDIITFPQVWGSTCGGLDVMPNGKPAFSGSAMTKEYTTVVYENATDTYFVFFGNQLAYQLREPNQNFFDDLKDHHIAPMSEATNRYIGESATPSERKNERIKELLKAAYYLLLKQKASPYTLNLLEAIVFYDGATSNGQCLLEDIAAVLGSER